MSKVKEYIIEKRVALAKYTDIEYNFVLDKIYYNCISKLMIRLKNELDEFVKNLFSSNYGMNVSVFTFTIDAVDEDRFINYLLFAESLNYSISINSFDNIKNLEYFLELEDDLKGAYDIVIYRDEAELYSYEVDTELYKIYKPEVLKEIHEIILNEYNDKLARIRDMSTEQVICSVCSAPSIDYVMVDQHNKVYDLRKCRLDD